MTSARGVFSIGQPGHNYALEYQRFAAALEDIKISLSQGIPLANLVNKQVGIARGAIDAVPVLSTSIILEAGSPFTAYCRLRALCESDATRSLDWLDPYFDASVFHRYLSGVRLDRIPGCVTPLFERAGRRALPVGPVPRLT